MIRLLHLVVVSIKRDNEFVRQCAHYCLLVVACISNNYTHSKSTNTCMWYWRTSENKFVDLSLRLIFFINYSEFWKITQHWHFSLPWHCMLIFHSLAIYINKIVLSVPPTTTHTRTHFRNMMKWIQGTLENPR